MVREEIPDNQEVVDVIEMVGYKTLHTVETAGWRCRECLESRKYTYAVLVEHLEKEHQFPRNLLNVSPDGCVWYASGEILAQKSE